MAGKTPEATLSLVQVALNSASISGTLRLFSELFGFQSAGGSPVWGKTLAVQDLPEEAQCIVWWLVGTTPFFQLEVFHHDYPVQRLLPPDWRPCDLGWVRLGVTVPDFDRVVQGLERFAVPVLGQSGSAPARRLAFREPYAGCIVEVIERAEAEGPSVEYVTSSVADLAQARKFYDDVVGAEIRPLEELHAPGDEALWGLAGAEREGFLACLPGGTLEIVHYISPQGRPRREDHRSSDQGLLNIAVGTRDHDVIRRLIGRIRDFGLDTTVVVDNDVVCGTYVVKAGYEMELMSIPPELDAALGFKPSANPFVNEVGG